MPTSRSVSESCCARPSYALRSCNQAEHQKWCPFAKQSTVVNLLEHFYEPQRGQVLLDGTPLDAIDHQYLHTQISLVSQEPVLFAGVCLRCESRPSGCFCHGCFRLHSLISPTSH